MLRSHLFQMIALVIGLYFAHATASPLMAGGIATKKEGGAFGTQTGKSISKPATPGATKGLATPEMTPRTIPGTKTK